MKKKLVLLLLTPFLIVACAPATDTTDGDATSPAPTVVATEKPSDTTGTTSGNVVEVTLDLANFSFTPSTIDAKAGDTVRVTVISAGGQHDFTLDELSVQSARVSGGSSDTVEFEIPASMAGQSLEFYCSVAFHRTLGMTGTLNIT